VKLGRKMLREVINESTEITQIGIALTTIFE